MPGTCVVGVMHGMCCKIDRVLAGREERGAHGEHRAA
jgi:hypothetical protein